VDVCYRHPSRETGVHCSNCGRPICPDCMTSTPVGMRCPECARQRTRTRTVRSVPTDGPALTYLLIGINVLIFLGGTLGGASATGGSFGGSPLLDNGSVSQATIADGEYWRLITAGFLHAGLFHLMFNMFALYVLGTMLEPAMGRLRFGLVYFVSLLAGSFGAILVEPNAPTVGASGAIFGLMGAAIVVLRHHGISFAESGLAVWLGLNLLITFTVSNISIGGHIGGLIGGTVAAAVLFELPKHARMSAVAANLICVGLGAAAVVGAIAISGSSA
jgi:membrane associated rhomboid family serine protease